VEESTPLLKLDVERALRQLPKDQARAIGLFYFSQWPIASIANVMARPEGTIKRWLHHGRRRLAIEMKGYGQLTLPTTERKTWKACVVGTEFTPVQLSCVTDALMAAGWNDVQTVTSVRSLDDLYIIDKAAVQQLRPGCERPTPQLSEPLAGCDALYLGEQIGGRSAFEFMPIVRAIRARLSMCLLLDQPTSCETADSSVYAAWLAGIDLVLTLGQEPAIFEHWFRKLREGIETAAVE
jgi:hypothetical protein